MKFRTGLLLTGVFIVGAAAGAVLPAIREAMAQDHPANETNAMTYQQLSLYGRIFERVRADYVTPEPASKLVYNSINGMLTGLDPHSAYMNKSQYKDMQVETSGEFGGLGIEVSQADGFIRVISPIDGTPAAKAGIKPNDLIVDINSRTTNGMTLDESVHAMRGPVGSKINLTIKRVGVEKPVMVTLTRQIIQIKAVHEQLLDNIAYIRLSSFSETANQDIRDAVRRLKRESHGKLRGYILDMRNNPGGLLDQGIAVADDFVTSGEIVSTHGRHPEDDEVWYAHSGDIADGLPMVVLENGGTASAAEIVTAALQQNSRAVVVGTGSFGKGSVQTIFNIPGDGALRLTTALYYTPSGKSIQDYGIAPDLVVDETRDTKDHFPEIREIDLPHAFHNPSGLKAPPLPPKLTLPAIAQTIKQRPPVGWPKLAPDKPATDYQLQMALKLVSAMTMQHPQTSLR